MVTTLIAKYCGGIATSLVAAIISIESGGNPKASFDGNYGLMQVRLNTAKFMKCEVLDAELCGTDKEGNKIQSCVVTKPAQLLDPDTNTNCGCRYLKYQAKRYNKNSKDMAAAYNLGSVFKNPDGTYQNQKYVDDVLRKM